MELIATAAGIFLAFLIGLVVTIIVMVNLRDLREWKRYMADIERNKLLMATTTTQNRLYEGNTQTFTVPKEEYGIPRNPSNPNFQKV